MDQLKDILRQLGKYHFWLLFATLLITPVVLSRCGANTLRATAETKTVMLQGGFDKTSRLANEFNPPNEEFVTTVNQLDQQVRAETEAAWRVLYEPQAPLRGWPDFGVPAFKDFVENQSATTPFPTNFRELYRTYARRQLSEGAYSIDQPDGLYGVLPLLRTVEVEEVVVDANGVEKPEKKVETRGIVAWDQGDRSFLEERFDFKATPSDKAMRFAQEDYWCYQALLRLIAGVNQQAGATEQFNAAIPRIITLAITQRALERQLSLFPGVTSVARAPGQRGAPPGTVPKNDASDADLEKSRYVDAEGKPLPSAAASPQKQFTYVPVCLQIVIDQRRVSEFLLSCSNLNPPLDVAQISFTTDLRQRALGSATGSAVAASGGGSVPAPAASSSARGLGGLMSARPGGAAPRPAAAGGAAPAAAAAGGNAPAAGARANVDRSADSRPFDVAISIRGMLRLVVPPPVPKTPPGAVAPAPGAAPADAPVPTTSVPAPPVAAPSPQPSPTAEPAAPAAVTGEPATAVDPNLSRDRD